MENDTSSANIPGSIIIGLVLTGLSYFVVHPIIESPFKDFFVRWLLLSLCAGLIWAVITGDIWDTRP